MITHDHARQLAALWLVSARQGNHAVTDRTNAELRAYLDGLPAALRRAAQSDLIDVCVKLSTNHAAEKQPITRAVAP